jgi:Uncharacterised nucleotidyltransferase
VTLRSPDHHQPGTHAADSLAGLVDVLAAVVRGDAPQWPANRTIQDCLLQLASEHGVDVLVATRKAALTGCPADLRGRLALVARDAAVIEVLRERELRHVLEALHHVGVRALLAKGTALAYTVYESPEQRPRVDTDLLVARAEVEAAIRALEAHGYSRTVQNVGQLVSHQIALARFDAHGVWHAIDVHWKVVNPHVFANLVTVEELIAGSVALPALGPHARTLSAAHALVIATVHLAAHHTHQLRLIWLYDLHLLCGRLTLPQFAVVTEFVRSRGLATVCAAGLHAARRWFDTRVPDEILADLDAVDAATEEPARYLAGSAGKLATLMSDLRVLPSWRARARLLYEHAFPPADFMLRSYHRSRRTWLPALYVHRMITGGWRWLRQA